MVKVLQYAPGFLSGGIESRMLDWYRNIDRSKIQFILVKLNNIDDTPNMKEFVSLGGKFYNLPHCGIKTVWSFEKKMERIIEEENIDIVHVHDVNSGLFALRAAKKCGIKCRIFHSRTIAFSPNERNLLAKKMIKRKAPKYATNYWACSKEAGIWGCGKQHKDELVVINNGIQDDLFVFNIDKRNKVRKMLGITNKKVVGTIGRITEQKNLPFLFDIMADLIDEDSDYVLLLVGDGNKSIIEEYCSQKKDISTNVITVGDQKNVWDYYMAMDVFCGTSLYEGFGTTAIESQATGVPTLLSMGFPKVVEVTDFVKRLETYNTDVWVENIKKVIGLRYPEQGQRGVIDHGYSAQMVAKQLEEFYLAHCEK